MNLICISEFTKFTIGRTYVADLVLRSHDPKELYNVRCDDGYYIFFDKKLFKYFELEADNIEKRINRILDCDHVCDMTADSFDQTCYCKKCDKFN